MAEPILVPPDPTIKTGQMTGMLSDELRRQLDEAYQGRNAELEKANQGKVAVPPSAPAQPRDPEGKFAKPSNPTPAPAQSTTIDPKAPPAPASKPAPAANDYPKGAEEWKKWKSAETERLRQEIQQELTSKPNTELLTLKEQLDAIAKEKEAIASRLREVAIERDPAFEKEFKTATSSVIQMATSVVGMVHADAMEKALNLPPGEARDTAIEKLMNGLPAYKQTQIGVALGRMDEIRALKEARIADAKANWSKYQEQHQKELAIQQERESLAGQKTIENVIKEWSDPEKGLAVLQRRDGDTEWNGKVDETIQLAREIYGGELELDELARAAIWAASAPRLLEELAIAHKEIKALKGGAAQDASLSPGATGESGSTVPESTGEQDYKGMNYGQIIAAKARSAGIGL